MLEIGFGARPIRLLALHLQGIDVTGVDLDKPILRGTPVEFVSILRKNGVERAVKSFVRYWLNDRRERRAVCREFADGNTIPRIPADRLVVSSAGDPAFWRSLEGTFDLIVSEDVFEHIPGDELQVVVQEMAGALSPGGVALIRPLIYSGISGGHHLEWYPHTIGRDISRKTEPWEHLRRDRNPANTYLNKLLRRDYRDLFLRNFEILEERVASPDLGRSLMTEEIRAELSEYSDEELFSNNVLFVLKPKH